MYDVTFLISLSGFCNSFKNTFTLVFRVLIAWLIGYVLQIRDLASHVVAYHFCQADNNCTCLVPDLIHSLAAQLCQAPQLAAYREYLLSEPHLQRSLSLRECTVDPDLALSRGIIEPLLSLRRAGRLPEINMVSCL